MVLLTVASVLGTSVIFALEFEGEKKPTFFRKCLKGGSFLVD